MRIVIDGAKKAAEQRARRAEAFARESDPLLAQWQAGEIEKETWLAKREEIRKRFPLPEGGK